MRGSVRDVGWHQVGQRVRVVMLYLTLLIGTLLTWHFVVPAGFYPNLAAAFFVGFCIYGPQMLIGERIN